MILVPVLRGSEIRDSPQSGGRRCPQIHRQYRFPNDKYAYSWIALLTERFFQCRGPLQAYCSSRGDEDEKSHSLRRLVEGEHSPNMQDL
jgi:hypothetical protein